MVEPEPTLDELREHQRTINATDLELIKDGDPTVAIAGWDKITYKIIVRNLGPNPADELRITDAFAKGLELVESSIPCVKQDDSTLRCDLSPLPIHTTAELTLVFATDAAMARQANFRTTTIVNVARASNELGPDLKAENNRDTAKTAVVPVAAIWYALDDRGVVASDQFWKRLKLKDPRPSGLLAPAGIKGEATPNFEGVHLASFDAVVGEVTTQPRHVRLTNRLGTFTGLIKDPPRHLLVPSAKGREDCDCVPKLPDNQIVPHYLCYDIDLRPTDNRPQTAQLQVSDQFLGKRTINTRLTQGMICNPSEKNDERSFDLGKSPHLMCLSANADPVGAPQGTRVRIDNQFGLYRRSLGAVEYLCLATEKTVEFRVPDRADLIIQSIDLATLQVTCPQGAGSCITTAKVSIANIGSEDAGKFVVKSTLDPAQSIVIPADLPDGVAAGASTTIDVKTGPGGNCFDPNCTVCAVADSEGEITEADETNNKMCVTKGG